MSKQSIRIAVFSIFLLSTSVLFVAAQEHGMNMKEHQITRKEAKALVVSAKTPEDYRELESFYRDEARRQEAAAKYHEEMAELYKLNPQPKLEMAKHCKYFADSARKAAEAANSMAEEYEKLAGK